MPIDRRRFLALSAGSAAAVGATTLTAAALRPVALGAQAPPQAPAAQAAQGIFTPLRRNVGCFSLRGGTAGFLVNEDAVAVVDSQFPDAAEVLLAGLGERSGARPVDVLVNTHHHGDHTGGNGVFRGVTRTRVAHAMAVEHLRNPPAGTPADADLIPEVTFTDRWSTALGDERITARHFGRAHTSGDAVITFEEANVAHMGDLMFHRRHPVVDRAAGATLRGWIGVLERTVAEHTRDTVYVFGHAGAGLPVTGTFTDLLRFRDYLDAVLARVSAEIQAGGSREAFLVPGPPLEGFEDFGPFGQTGAREVRTCAWDELAEGRQG
jgi:cyclase